MEESPSARGGGGDALMGEDLPICSYQALVKLMHRLLSVKLKRNVLLRSVADD